MYKKILWATDFTDHASNAGKYALQCAHCSGGQVYALTVIDPDDLPLVQTGVPDLLITAPHEVGLMLRLEEEDELQILDRLEQAIRPFRDANVKVETLLRVGTSWNEIVRAANELRADLIMLGSHGKHNLDEFILGSTTVNVARRAHCPVVIVSQRPPHTERPHQRMLFATDFSAHAEEAQKVASALAKEGGQHLWVLTVIEPGDEIPMPPGFVIKAPDNIVFELQHELREDVENKVNQQLDQLIAGLQQSGIQAEKLTRHGLPAKEIAKAAIDLDADFIILGSHSRRTIGDVFLGNTPEKLSHYASCPILIVSFNNPQKQTSPN